MKKTTAFHFLFFVLLLSSNSRILAATWSKDAKNTLGVKLGAEAPGLNMELNPSSPVPGVDTIKYNPHSIGNIFASFSYGAIGLRLSTNTTPDDESRRLYGDSKIQDWQFRFYGKYATYDFFYQDYSGYYIEKSSEIQPNLSSNDPRIQRPDITNRHYGVQAIFVFQPDNYSVGSSFEHSYRQTESGGSFLGTVGLNQHQITADSALIPTQVQSRWGDFSQFQRGRFNTARLGIGYGYNLILNQSFYASALLALNIGLQEQYFDLGPSSIHRWVSNIGSNAKIGLGYNGEKNFVGFQILADLNEIPIANAKVGMSTLSITAFIGTRFSEVHIPLLDKLEEAYFH